MLTVRELFEKLKQNRKEDLPIMVKDLDGNYIPLVQSFYVEDDTLFLFTKSNKNLPLTSSYLMFYLESEACDKCWDICCGESSFLDCGVCIVFGEWDDESNYYEKTYEADCFFLSDTQLSCICDFNEDEEYDEDESNDIERDIVISLSSEEFDMICESLNYYGDKIADSVGYSAGEKYWNLIEFIKKQ